MMKANIYTLFLGLLLFSTSCEQTRTDGGEWVKYKDYLIDGYIAVAKLDVRILGGFCHLSFSGTKVSECSQDPQEAAEFKRLSQLHGGWLGRDIAVPEGLGRSEYICYDDQIVSIDVSSDVAWDDAHPAGGSLNDICSVAAISVAEFVRNNNSGIVLREVARPLDQLKEGDLEMIIDGFTRFSFDTPWTASSKPTIFVRTHMKSGRVFTDSITL